MMMNMFIPIGMIEEKVWTGIVRKHLLGAVEQEIAAKSKPSARSTRVLKTDVAPPFKQILVVLIEYGKPFEELEDNSDSTSSYLLSSKAIKDIIKFIFNTVGFDGESTGDDSDRRFSFGAACCDILKSILGVRRYSSRINDSTFDELLQTFGDVLLKVQLQQVDAVHYSSCFEALVMGYCRDLSNEHKAKILDLLEDYFTGQSKNNFEKVQLNLMSVLNILSERQGLNMTEVIRHLGNKICSPLLDIWSSTNNEHLKVSILG